MVKLVVLDIDGVIVGHKIGYNFPYPEVANTLGISLHETLGVGDTLGDWEFMKLF